jgi:two-component system response regulator TctD
MPGLVRIGGILVQLGRRETALLRLLAAYPERMLSRATLLARLYPGGSRGELGNRTLDALVWRLRRKMGPSGDAIRTGRGLGYGLSLAPVL